MRSPFAFYGRSKVNTCRNYRRFFTQVNMSTSSRNKKEDEIASQSEEALEEVNSHIKEVFDILKRETLKVRKEMETFDTVAKKLKYVHFSKTLKLNVGGQLFSTSLETMKKDPGSFSSLFMLRIKADPLKREL